MSFSIPKLEIPKLPQVDPNAAIGNLTKTFDPSADVGAISGNITSQLNALESMRSQLSSLRLDSQKAAAQADYKALSAYTIGLQQMTDASCIMSSARPSFVPMTTSTLELPLMKGAGGLLETNFVLNPIPEPDPSNQANGLAELPTEQSSENVLSKAYDFLEDSASKLAKSKLVANAVGTYTGIDTNAIRAVQSGNVSKLTSLACAGAGGYISNLTGGAISPGNANKIIKSIAGESTRDVISGVMSGDLTALSKISPPVLTGTTALNVAKAALGSDASGKLLGHGLSQTCSNVINKLSNKSLSELSFSDLERISKSAIKSIGASSLGSNIGGYNLNNATSLAISNGIKTMVRAAKEGNIKSVSNMLDVMQEKRLPNSLFKGIVKDLAKNLPINRKNVETYKDMVDKYTGINPVSSSISGTRSINVVDETKSSYNSPIAESLYGKDEARKRNAILDIVKSKNQSNLAMA